MNFEELFRESANGHVVSLSKEALETIQADLPGVNKSREEMKLSPLRLAWVSDHMEMVNGINQHVQGGWRLESVFGTLTPESGEEDEDGSSDGGSTSSAA